MAVGYAFLWHVLASDEVAAGCCESAETSGDSEDRVAEKLGAWLKARQDACTEPECACKAGGSITDRLTPKMIMAGMTQHMVKLP